MFQTYFWVSMFNFWVGNPAFAPKTPALTSGLSHRTALTREPHPKNRRWLPPSAGYADQDRRDNTHPIPGKHRKIPFLLSNWIAGFRGKVDEN